MKYVVIIATMMFCALSLCFSYAAAPEKSHKHSVQGLSCVDCHDEENPAELRAGKHPIKDLKKCAECHGELEDVAELTMEVEPNPHTPHDGRAPCSDCHFEHKPSVVYCDECHAFGLKTP